MSEFTGERVIPGLVDPDLLNEHVARYRFAARFASGLNVLDAGCGSGYGTAALDGAASVTAMDISADAIRYSSEHFARPSVRFLQGSCGALPFADASFDLATAFEVIEHLEHWQDLLIESHRVLKPAGVFLVSTPNKDFYAESRAQAGPNPFHCHEFEYAEFEAALYEVFRHVRVWTQNHAESIVFAPLNPLLAAFDAQGDPTPENANFFVAACSDAPIAANEVYAWLPTSANILRDRQLHVAKLGGELKQKDFWLEQLAADHDKLQREHERTLAELRESNEWAGRADREAKERGARIVALQDEAETALAWIRQLESDLENSHREIERLETNRRELETDLAARTKWARSIEEQLKTRTEHVRLQSAQIADQERQLIAQLRLLDERAGFEAQVRRLLEERRLIAQAKWIRLGRKLNLGPSVTE